MTTQSIDDYLAHALDDGKLTPGPVATGLKVVREDIYRDFDRGVEIEKLVRARPN